MKNKQTKLSDKGGDLGSKPRREFYLFPYFSVIPPPVCERKLQRLEWCDFDQNRNMRALKFIRKKFNTVLQDCSISFYISIYVDDQCK